MKAMASFLPLQEEFPNRLMPNGAARDLHAMKEARARGRALLKAERFELGTATTRSTSSSTIV